MVRLVNRNGSVMYVHESRLEEYTKAGFIADKVEKAEPKPMPKAEPKEEPMHGSEEKPKAIKGKTPSFKKPSAKKRG